MTIFKKIKNTLALLALLISSIVFSQQQQKYINYQGVARDASDEVIASQPIDIQVALRFGTTAGAAAYTETHTVTTDVSGVFSLQIGNGTVLNGVYNNLEWGVLAPYATISLNGTEVGTVELQSVPYANASGKAKDMEINDLTNVDGMPTNGQVLKYNGTSWEPSTDETSTGGTSSWTESGDDIYYNDGNVGINNTNPLANLDIEGNIILRNDFFTDSRTGITIYGNGDAPLSASGINTVINPEGDGHVWSYNSSIGGNATGNKYGYETTIITNATGTQYGFSADLTNSSPSTKYGISTLGEDRNYFSGNVGIGDSNPDAKLHVRSSSTGDNPQLLLEEIGTNSFSSIKFTNGNSTASSNYWRMNVYSGDAAEERILFYNRDAGKDVVEIRPEAVVIDAEVNRPSTGNANMLPIAYGYVDSDGTVINGSGNFTVQRLSLGSYIVTINGESITEEDYIFFGNSRFSNINFAAVNNLLEIKTFSNSNNNFIGQEFSFIIYKP